MLEIGQEHVGRIEVAIGLDVFQRLVALLAVQIAEKADQNTRTFHRDLGSRLGTRHKAGERGHGRDGREQRMSDGLLHCEFFHDGLSSLFL